MAAFTVTTDSQTVYISNEGGANINDSVAIRLAPGATGTVYIERSSKGTAADEDTSFFITGEEVYSSTAVAGIQFNVITDTGTVDIRIDADDSGTFG